MAANAGGIRAGAAYVEVGIKDKLSGGLNKAALHLKTLGASIKAVGASAQAAGVGLLKFGAIGAAPFLASAKVFSTYEDAMASLRAAANPTAKELQTIEAAIMSLSRETGKGPAEIATAFGELLKAGVPMAGVLGGAAKATLHFAKVASVDAAEAAIVLADAMNVFGVDATTAVDTLSKAADASSISVRDVTQGFSMCAAVAKMAGFSIGETANALALLGAAGVKGSDAGTSLKTMLLRLQTGAEGAGQTMAALGIHVRKADGSMKDARSIIAELQKGLSRLGGQAKAKAMADLFGTDAIRAASILLDAGVEGWDAFQGKMEESLPVAKKFDILMSTLSGTVSKLMAVVERIAVAVGSALAPMFMTWGDAISAVGETVAKLITANKGLVVGMVQTLAGAAGAGLALVTLGSAISAVGAGLGIIGGLIAALPFVALGAAVAGSTLAFVRWTDVGQRAVAAVAAVFKDLKTTVASAMGGVMDALNGGDLALAGNILAASFKLASIQIFGDFSAIWPKIKVGAFDALGSIWAGMQSGFVSAIGAVQDTFSRFFGFLRKSWIDIFSFMSKAVNLATSLANPFFDRKAADAEIDAGAAASKGEVDRSTRDTLDSRESGRAAERDAIDRARREAEDARHAELAKSLGAPGEALEKARAELQKLLDEAKAKANPTADTLGLDEYKPSMASKALTPEGIDAGMEKAARTVSVKGSFDASGGLQGQFGIGDTVTDAVKNGVKEAKKTNEKLDGLRRDVQHGGGLV